MLSIRKWAICLQLMRVHYTEVIMSVMGSQITGVSIVYSIVCSGTDQRKYQSSVSLAFVRGIHQWPVNSLHKGPVTRKMFPFDDVHHEGSHPCARRTNSPDWLSAECQFTNRLIYPGSRTNFLTLSRVPNYYSHRDSNSIEMLFALVQILIKF